MSRTLALVGILAFAIPASAAFAQSPQIPTPVNPFPYEPVATNGTPLPSQAAVGSPYGVRGSLYSGRSVGLDAPVALVPGLVDGGLGLAGSAVDGLGSAAGALVAPTR